MSCRIRAYQDYIDRRRRNGDALVTYDCPHCGEALHSLQPTELQEPFSTLIECPYCEQKHFRVVWATGLCEVNPGDGLGFREADTSGPREVG